MPRDDELIDGGAEERERWSDLRDRRLRSPTARVAYEQAQAAHEVGDVAQEGRGQSQREHPVRGIISHALSTAVFQRLASMVRDRLRSAGVTEQDVLADFQASRRRSRR